MMALRRPTALTWEARLARRFAVLWWVAGVIFAAASAQAADGATLDADLTVLSALRGLAPNHAVDLGKARVLGEFNEVVRRFGLHRSGPRGRDYSIKMAWAPERKRALFAGANHGVPHRLNDVWEFDLGALSWVLLYPPDHARSYLGLGEDASDVEYRDGVLVTQRGGPAIVGHTWWGLAYHPGLRRMLWMNTWVADTARLVEKLGGDPETRYRGLPLWSFDPVTARWELLRTTRPAPFGIFGGMLEYVDSLGEVLWHGNDWRMRATWMYESARQGWKNLDANAAGGDFQRQAPRPEQVGYYDPGRDLLVVQRGRSTHHFDVKRNEWTRVRNEPADSSAVPDGHDARTVFVHDSATSQGLLVDFRSSTVWAYDPDSHAWTKLAPAGDPMPTGKKRLAYFDPAHRVLVVIEGVRVWAYRPAAIGS